MAPHPGIEHDTVPALEALMVWDGKYTPPRGLLTLAQGSGPGPHISPNQWATLVALRLRWAWASQHDDLRGALAQARALLLTMQTAGHMCTGGAGYSNEALCPDPHSRIWIHAMAAILRDALLTMEPVLIGLAIDYWAQHVALCLCHWTEHGVRVATFRADAAPGQDPQPNWALDSLLVAEIANIPPPIMYKGSRNDTALQALRQSRGAYPRILAAAKVVRPVLRIPLQRHDIPDGSFVSALHHDEAANGRMSWVKVDAVGEIVESSNTLDNLPGDYRDAFASQRAGMFGLGDGQLILSRYAAGLIGDSMGWKATMSKPNNLPNVISSPPPPPTTPVPPTAAAPTPTITTAALVTRLQGYMFDRTDNAKRRQVFSDITQGGLTTARLASIADWLDGAGVNKDSAQGKDIAALVAELRQMVVAGGSIK